MLRFILLLLKHTGWDSSLRFGNDQLRVCLKATLVCLCDIQSQIVLVETYKLRLYPEIWHWWFKSLFDSYPVVPVWHSEPIVLVETFELRLCLEIWHWSIKSMFNSYAVVLVWHSELIVLVETYKLRLCLEIWHWSIKSLFESYTVVRVWHLEPNSPRWNIQAEIVPRDLTLID